MSNECTLHRNPQREINALNSIFTASLVISLMVKCYFYDREFARHRSDNLLKSFNLMRQVHNAIAVYCASRVLWLFQKIKSERHSSICVAFLFTLLVTTVYRPYHGYHNVTNCMCLDIKNSNNRTQLNRFFFLFGVLFTAVNKDVSCLP